MDQITRYIDLAEYWWQGPLIIVFLVGWLIGGGWLLRRSLNRAQPGRKHNFFRCVLAMILGGGAGVMAGGVMFLLVDTIGKAAGVSLTLLGAPVGLIAAVLMAYLVLYVMYPLKWGRVLRAGAPALGAVVALALVVAAASAIPARSMFITQLRRQNCQDHIKEIAIGLGEYDRRFPGQVPADLKTLVERNLVAAKKLQCPSAPDREVGYFYMPVQPVPNTEPPAKLRLCDWPGNHPDGRNVFFANGDIRWKSTEQFDSLLKLPVNEVFAERLAAAEEQLDAEPPAQE